MLFVKYLDIWLDTNQTALKLPQCLLQWNTVAHCKSQPAQLRAVTITAAY